MRFGAHMSTAGGVWKALERAHQIGAQTCQIFVKNNMRWFGQPPAALELARYRQALAALPGISVFGHTGYLINLAAPPSEKRDASLKSLLQEIECATALGLPFLVMHPGAHLGTGETQGIQQVAKGLDEVFAVTAHSPVRIALENTAGQGSCLGWRIRHLAFIFNLVQRPERLGICLDTAHLFAAGYDIRTPAGWDAVWNEVGEMVGLKAILAFHLNDSKADLGARVDRHAHIGLGKIGKEGFRLLVNDSRFSRHPGCLETPKSKDLHEDIANLKTLRSLVEASRKRRLG
jgi:deoxyribonuclease IV